MSKLYFFSKISIAIAIVFAVGQFSYLHPADVQAAPLADDMATLSTAVAAAKAQIATPTAAVQEVKNTLSTIQDHAKLTAQLVLSNALSIEISSKAQVTTAQNLQTNTQKQKATAAISLTVAQIQLSQAQMAVAQIQTTLLVINQAGLTLAQLERAIATGNEAKARANSLVTSATNAVSLSMSLAEIAAADAKTSAQAAVASAEIALAEATIWLTQAQEELLIAEAALLASYQNTSTYTAAQAAVFAAQAVVVEATNAKTQATQLKTTARSTLAATEAQIVATTLITALALEQLRADSIALSVIAGAAAVSASGSSADSGFNAGAFIGRAIGPCAAVAIASAVAPLAIGTLTGAMATAAMITNVPTTAPVEAFPAGRAAFTEQFKDFGDCLIYTMGQLMLNNITESTVNWIKGGFNGSPSFATDLNSILDGAEDIVGGDFVRQLRGIAVCDFTPTFIDDLSIGLELGTKKNARNMFTDKVTCPFGSGPLLKYTSSQFYNDFSQGGWRAFEASLSDSGNPFGVSLIASQELNQRKASQAEVDKEKRSWSAGFADIIDNNNCPNMPQDVQDYINGTSDGETITPGDPATVRGLQKQWCKTTTPGKIVEGELSKALGSDVERIGFADSLDKIIHTLITTLMQRTVKSIF